MSAHPAERLDLSELEALVGLEEAKRLWDLAEEAKATVRERVARHAIDWREPPCTYCRSQNSAIVTG